MIPRLKFIDSGWRKGKHKCIVLSFYDRPIWLENLCFSQHIGANIRSCSITGAWQPYNVPMANRFPETRTKFS